MLQSTTEREYNKMTRLLAILCVGITFILMFISLLLVATEHRTGNKPTNSCTCTEHEYIQYIPNYLKQYNFWVSRQYPKLKRFNLDYSTKLDILHNVYTESTYNNINPDIVLSVIHVESSYQKDAISTAGAQGLMQVMPFWKKYIGQDDDDLLDLKTNIRYGVMILSIYKADSDIYNALKRYNGTTENRYSNKVLRAWAKYWRVDNEINTST